MGIYSGLYKSSYSGAYRFSPSNSYTYLQFNGSDQYAEHAPFTPTGVNFTLSARYTPAAADIDSLVTLWGDGVLEKDASNNLVFNYTDTAAASQATTLTALALVADTEYLITVSSDGNGVSVTVGADTALNATIIDPSTLEIESWMASNGATLSSGIIRDIDFQDDSAIQNGTFLQGDGAGVWVEFPDIEMTGEFTVEGYLVYNESAGDTDFIGSAASDSICLDVTGSSLRVFAFPPGGGGLAFSVISTTAPTDGQHTHYRITRDDSSDIRLFVDGTQGGPTRNYSGALTFRGLFQRGGQFANAGDHLTAKITDDTNGDTYEYLLNNITSEGIAPNTGNTGSSFDGTVQNYDASTGLVTIPNNTRNYPVATDGNIQPDTLNADGANLVNLIASNWVRARADSTQTNNGNGDLICTANEAATFGCSFSLNTLEVGKVYEVKTVVAEFTGTSDMPRLRASPTQLNLTGDFVVNETPTAVGVELVTRFTATSAQLYIGYISVTPTIGDFHRISSLSLRETTSAEVINFDQSMVQS